MWKQKYLITFKLLKMIMTLMGSPFRYTHDHKIAILCNFLYTNHNIHLGTD